MKLLPHLADDTVRIGTGSVTLVDECDPWNLVAVHLSVNGDALALDSADGAQHQYCPVQDPEGPLDLDCEVDVTRSINDVDLISLPVDACGGTGDCYSSFSLKLHAVHGGSDSVLSMDFVDRVDPVAVVQDPLAEGCLSGINVRADSNVSHL